MGGRERSTDLHDVNNGTLVAESARHWFHDLIGSDYEMPESVIGQGEKGEDGVEVRT